MLALLLLAASAAAQVVQFNTPDPGDNITVCGQLSVTWGFDLGSLDGDTLFNLILAPADSTPVPTTSYDGLTTVEPSLSSGGSPGRRDRLWRRDGAVLTIVSPSLLIAQGSYTIAQIDAPAGTYVLDGSVDGNPDVTFVPSGTFVVTDSADESCVPPPPTPALTAASNSTSASATSTAPSSDSGSHGISAGAIAGAAIGGFLAGLGVFIALFLLFCRRRPAPVDAETPMTPLESKAMRLDSSVPSTARLDSPVPPSPHIPPHQRAELTAALEAAHFPGATKS